MSLSRTHFDLELPPIVELEEILIANRPDINVIRREIHAIALKAELKEPWTYSNIRLGSSTEREPDGLIVSGPAVELEFPVFNYGQGERIKHSALLEQAQKKLIAKIVQGLSEVREYYNTIFKFRSLLQDLESNILPHLAQQVHDGQAQLNVMNIGIYDLFNFKEDQIRAQIEHLQALMHHQKAVIELIHAVGGSFAQVRVVK